MPPRARGRAAAAAATATTSSKPRARKAAPAPTVTDPTDTADNGLRPHIAAIFRDAQKTTASHRKLVVSLRKIHEACCYEPVEQKNAKSNSLGDFDEADFNNEFMRAVLRIMPVRKSESAGEKTVRFTGLFLRYAIEKDNEYLGAGGDADGDDEHEPLTDTPSMRLTSGLIELVLPLLMSRDKTVRFRASQLISHITNSLDAVDDELFQKLRKGLLRRIHDKEAMVRTQAVVGLGRLAGNEAGEDDDVEHAEVASSGVLLGKLLDVLQNDPSADVRKTLLLHLPLQPDTLAYLLERARDQDAAARRSVYTRVLPALGDFRHLSLNMREKLLRWGLRDRDENVRKAAGRLFTQRWIEDCAGTEEDQKEGMAEPRMEALMELLERIDVVNSGIEDGIALEAMRVFWENRPDYRDFITFVDGDDNDHPHRFWETLSAESVFIARTLNDYCRSPGNEHLVELIDEKLPELTKFGFYLERYVHALIQTIQRNERNEKGVHVADEQSEEEEDTIEQEFIVEQLLHIALTLDYSDEVGRRKMFALLRQSLSIPELPDEITRLTVDVLRDICASDAAGEREFCSVVLEAVADVHDTIAEDEPEVGTDVDDDDDADGDNDDDVGVSFHSVRSQAKHNSADSGSRPGPFRGHSMPTVAGQKPKAKPKPRAKDPSPPDEEDAHAKALKEILINLKCLHIVQCMLTNVQGHLQDNESLVSMLNNLVVPAVRSHEAPVREKGLVCLGLCALLDRSLAEENLQLFMHFFAKGHSALQVTALHILTDVLNVHGAHLMSANPVLLKLYLKALRSSASKNPEVQTTATVAACKLLLGRIVVDLEASCKLLRTLVIAYFDPGFSSSVRAASASSTADTPATVNQGVKQALNYFIPVFAFSRASNQQMLRHVALEVIHALQSTRELRLEQLENQILEQDSDSDSRPHGTTAAAAAAAALESSGVPSMSTIAACLIDWTDPRKCVELVRRHQALEDAQLLAPETRANTVASMEGDDDVHLDLLLDIVGRVTTGTSAQQVKDEHDDNETITEQPPRRAKELPEPNAAERKVLITMLPKLYLPAPPRASAGKLRIAMKMLTEIVEDEDAMAVLAPDAASRNALAKVLAAVTKVATTSSSSAIPEVRSPDNHDGREFSVNPETHETSITMSSVLSGTN